MRITQGLFRTTALLSITVAGLVGCSNSDDDDGGLSGQLTSLLIANDQGSDQGEIERHSLSTDLTTPLQTFDAGLAEGVAGDSAGNLYQAGISGTGTVRALCGLSARADAAAFDTQRDRSLTAALTGPKGTAVAQDAGLILVTENGAADNAVSVFSVTAADAAATLLSIPRAAVGDTGAWDVAYDEASDRLFVALINGDVAYFANYLANATNGPGSVLDPALLPTAIFRPDNALAVSNMHGIVYEADVDRLIVSDVADPMSADDGSIYVFENASTLSGAVTPDRLIRGASTLLGNPVDLQLRGDDLIVAEKANNGGRILVFNNVASGAGGDVAPDRNLAYPAPESLIAVSAFGSIDADISDLTGQTVNNLLVSSNAGNMGTQVITVATDLSASSKTFTATLAGQFLESLALDQNGDAVVSFDDAGAPSTGGLSFINRLNNRADADLLTAGRDRQILGASSDLIAPKGVETVGSLGLVMVADLNAAAPGAIKVFSLCATDNVAPLFVTTLPAGTRPWDLDYDPIADRLYVAATDGTVLVFDDYAETQPTTPDRIIDPDDQSGFMATNIHGIVHDASTDRLILSDVGDPASATDGRIYVINNASSASGTVSLRLEIAGNNTLLGNPVDIAFDGSDLYIAEKSNNQLQRINDLYALTGQLNVAPDASLAFTAPESIALSPDYLP